MKKKLQDLTVKSFKVNTATINIQKTVKGGRLVDHDIDNPGTKIIYDCTGNEGCSFNCDFPH